MLPKINVIDSTVISSTYAHDMFRAQGTRLNIPRCPATMLAVFGVVQQSHAETQTCHENWAKIDRKAADAGTVYKAEVIQP